MRLYMQNAAAIRTASWVSASLAPASSARSISVRETARGLRCTPRAISTRAAIFGERPSHPPSLTLSTRAATSSAPSRPSSSDANAPCESMQ